MRSGLFSGTPSTRLLDKTQDDEPADDQVPGKGARQLIFPVTNGRFNGTDGALLPLSVNFALLPTLDQNRQYV
jgi:hypothetical protein